MEPYGALIIQWVIIGAVTAVKNLDIVYSLLFLWAYTGILIKHTSSSGFAGQHTEVISTVIISIILLILALVYIVCSGKKLEKKPNS